MKNIKTRLLIRMSLALFLLSSFQGCGVIVPGTPWSSTNYIGPLLPGNNHAAVVQRCATVGHFMSNGPCELAFVDHRKQKVLWMDVRKAIDEYLPKIAPLAPWLVPNERVSNVPRSPFELHILTISPVVVLAVPRQAPIPGADDYCGGPIYQSGCMPTERLRLGSYWYRRNPMIGSGSFWFSPTLSSGVTFLPDNARTYTIELPDSRIELAAHGNEWSIQRNVLTK